MRKVLLTMFISFSVPAFASSWTPYFLIDEMKTRHDGGFWVTPVDTTILTGAGCDLLRAYPNQHGLTTHGVASAQAMAMMAFMAGRKIKVYYDDSGYCYIRWFQMSKDE